MIVAIAGVVAGTSKWLFSAASWIYQRHAFVQQSDVFYDEDCHYPGVDWNRYPNKHGPPSLWLFGETSPTGLSVPESKMARARDLFPEAEITNRTTGSADRPK